MDFPLSPWTDELAHRVAHLWVNHSAGQIAALLASEGISFTRNQIIGKMHRFGAAKIDQPKPIKEKVERPSRNVGVRKQPGAKLPSLPFVPRVVEAEPRHVALLDLADGDCRYECSGTDDPAIYTFCGNPSVAGYSYCFAHKSLCIVPAKPPTPFVKKARAA